MTAGQLTTPHRHVHAPHVSRRSGLVVGLAVAVVAIAATATAGIVGRTATSPVVLPPHTAGHADLAMPGEFLLPLGNLQPIGVAVALPPSLVAMRGEFRLGPGNLPGPGIERPLGRLMTPVEPLYASGEFVLGPGNTQPPGIVVPLYDTPVPGEFILGPGNMQPPGTVVAFTTGA
jgi:hypothetical protein